MTSGQKLPQRVARDRPEPGPGVRSPPGHRRKAEENGLRQARDGGGRPDVLAHGQVMRIPGCVDA
ncbi:hypothetical protein FH965_07150 [Streptomyces spectabilis]|uniref:Uncharacterized protein n=1 Tax=Streptomyces spectabilis TaxID=68270 RepID=A0A516R3X6_STRST|nr:hypothetical protein FH965_07150 [Streptomyces spectabilis]